MPKTQTFVDRRKCYKCRKVGHIVANCNYEAETVSKDKSNRPHKKKGERKQRIEIVPPKKPKAEVNDSEVKLSRPQQRRLNKRLRKEKILQKQPKSQPVSNNKVDSSVKTVNNKGKQKIQPKGSSNSKVSKK